MQKQPFLEIAESNYDFSSQKIHYTKFIQKNRKELSLHKHNCYELGICLKGAGTFFVNERIFPFVKGDFSFIPPNVAHIATSPDDMPSEWIFFFIDKSAFTHTPTDISAIIQSLSCYQLMNIMYNELEKKNANYYDAVKNILSILTIKINRHIKDDISLNTDNPISPALQYISKNYFEKVDIDALAELCYLSTTHFRRLFKKETGFSPLKYINKIRLEVSSGLLITTDAAVLDISIKSGFATLSSFNRYFKEYFGISPSEYRIKNTKNQTPR